MITHPRLIAHRNPNRITRPSLIANTKSQQDHTSYSVTVLSHIFPAVLKILAVDHL